MTSERILIIEDDPSLLRGLKDNFEFAGYIVETASTGVEGLDASLNSNPDLIILDLMLPEMNGYEICRLIREEGLNIPIIMLTAKSQESDIVLGLNLGADDYVTKPFSIRELLARTEAFLRRRRKSEPEVIEFGECKMDLAGQVFIREGKEVKLSPKEFRLLRHFLLNPNRVLSRDEILNKVWGYNQYVTSRSIDRFVTTLRKKIEPDSRNPTFIITIREIGYKFRLEINEQVQVSD